MTFENYFEFYFLIILIKSRSKSNDWQNSELYCNNFKVLTSKTEPKWFNLTCTFFYVGWCQKCSSDAYKWKNLFSRFGFRSGTDVSSPCVNFPPPGSIRNGIETIHPVMESARQRFNLGSASFRFPVMAFVTFAPEGSNPAGFVNKTFGNR